MRILIAEDDEVIQSFLQKGLAAEGYQAVTCGHGPEIWEMGETEDFAAIILDLGLPGMDGLSILKRWRKAGVKTPVLVLTARGSWMERVDGFDAGADDYLPKPFRQEELIARLRAVLRRSGSNPSSTSSAGRFTLDDAARQLMFDGQIIDVSPLEYRMIAYLIGQKGRVVSPLELAHHVQGRDDDSAKNAVEAMVARLRRKTAPEAIETRRGFGYVLADESE